MDRIIIKCPYCDAKYVAPNKEELPNAKKALYSHMEENHQNDMGGMSPSQSYFNYKNRKLKGNCVICGKETKWNESTEHYERFCSDKCKKAYRQQFLDRMKKAGKENIMNDPEHQKMMLSHRKISGVYTWSDKKHKFNYTGSYEKDFLEFLDVVMNYDPEDIMAPAPQVFYYTYEGKKHFYIPDFYITSLNLLVEIKDGGANPNKHHKIQEVDKEKERLKDAEMAKHSKEINYLKVTDKDYSIYLNYLLTLKYQE
jgi:endogenous inhibitor of DNA gyrase (YacG/DUF329 family)